MLTPEQISKFTAAKNEFENGFFDSEPSDDGNKYPILCEIHDTFDSLTDENSTHNCLGCNFAYSAWMIKYFFDRMETYESLHDAQFELIMRLYLMVERMNIIFKIVELPQSYRLKNFKTSKLITKWANFIKHPKAFIFTHHPKFYQCGQENRSEEGVIWIDDDFVLEFYSGENDKKNRALFDKIANSEKVKVIFPCPEMLLKNFSKESEKFKSIICDNQVYSEILNDISTLEDYFDDVDQNEEDS